MAYQPFALKYRPQTFADLVGQEVVCATLQNALKSDRVVSAFLFSGSRGVGKTSAARILACALNCPEGADPEVSAAIFRGEDVDVIEIDGASNRGIDEIRAIRDNVGYAPSRSPYKIYIIDEVHMLTIQAFNALLKTLEEPPPHVKFIFATTEVQAVPDTIVSRCQRYEFRRIRVPDLARRLRHICLQEGVEASDEVLEEISRRSEGGLRDSISLLEQALAFSGNEITQENLDRALGRIDRELLGELLSSTGAGDAGRLLDTLDEIFDTGRDPEDILLQVLEVLREAMLRDARKLPGGGQGRWAPLVVIAREHFDTERLLFALRIALNTRREIKFAGQGRLQLELAFLKLARSRDLLPLQELLRRLEDDEGPASALGQPTPGPAGRPAGPPAPGPRAPSSPTRPGGQARAAAAQAGASGGARVAGQHQPAPSLEHVRAEWGPILALVRGRSPRTGALLEGGAPEALKGRELTILLPASQGFARDQLRSSAGTLVQEVMQAQLGGEPLRLHWELALGAGQGPERRPRRSAYEDRDVRKLLDHFEGSITSVEHEEGS